MARPTTTLLLLLGLTAAFTTLFYDTGIGINLLVFEILAAGAWLLQARGANWTLVLRLATASTAATAIAVVVHASAMVIALNVISGVLTVGLLVAPQLSATHHAFLLAIQHAWKVPVATTRLLTWQNASGAQRTVSTRTVLTTASVPLLLALFAALYGASNPFFGDLVARFYAGLAKADLALLYTLGLGAFCSAFLLIATQHERFLVWAGLRTDTLARTPPPVDRGEYRTAIVLFAALNLLLLLLNVLDVQHVWMDFTFSGQYLKDFVHQGTWMLIISIVMGAALVLYFFRGDLNFIRGNAPLKWLCLAWLLQNAMLAASVAVRNYWYIHHFGLAYKRIGVILFLLAALVGLWLVMRKVTLSRSSFYLTRWNLLAAYVIVVAASLFDWDTLIARYNIEHRKTIFVELSYLLQLDEKVLPYLSLSDEDLSALHEHNETVLGSDRYWSYSYMSPDDYKVALRSDVQDFWNAYPDRSWREWNWADARAYDLLAEKVIDQ